MKQQSIFDYINVDGLSLTPKYIQLANSIQDAVLSGKIECNGALPSLHELTYHLEISKETADRGYKYLRDLGVLASIPGKGHYVTAAYVERQRKIFLVIDKLNAGKKAFYDLFAETLGEDALIELHVYNGDFNQFKKIIDGRRDGYTHYVIHTDFTEHADKANELINTLPKDKLVLINNDVDSISGEHGCIFENPRRNIYRVLQTLLTELSKYDTLKIIASKPSLLSPDMMWGFNLFCQQYGFDRSVMSTVCTQEVAKGEVFICLNDDDLVPLVEHIQTAGFKVGEDVGIISFNETPLKQYVLNGISTLTADYEQMALQAAGMILKNRLEKVELDYKLILRKSL